MEVVYQKLAEKICKRMIDKGLVAIGVSARHVHLTREDVDVLFGVGYELTIKQELSQPGYYVYKERVNVHGPKGVLKNVAILGPCRPLTQIELSQTDARQIGINAPIRISGNTKGTPGCKLSTDNTSIETKDGVIVAKRHIHVTPEYAQKFNINQGDNIAVRVLSERPLVFEDVEVRIGKEFKIEVHIDVDEANSAGVSAPAHGILLPKVKG